VKPEPVVVKPEPVLSQPFNATAVSMQADVKPFEEPDMLDNLGLDSDVELAPDPPAPLPTNPYLFSVVDPENIIGGGFEAPALEEVDEEVVELRRSTRKTERVSYEETIDDLDIVERRVKYLRNMMRYVPDELKEVISQEDLQWFGRHDEYILSTMVTSSIIKKNHPEFRSRNILFPADVFGAGEEDQTDEVQRKYIYDALGRYLEYFEEDENIYRQFSVALMWKHTCWVLSLATSTSTGGNWTKTRNGGLLCQGQSKTSFSIQSKPSTPCGLEQTRTIWEWSFLPSGRSGL
jgi:hypothetical protein